MEERRVNGSGGIEIAYRIVGEGPDLMMHHGFSRSGVRWQSQGYVDSLSQRFRLILLDARGHGQSDKPHDPADYTLDHRVADVLAVMDVEGIEMAHHWGYSMGGQVCYHLAVSHAERVRSVVIGGMHPFERDPAPLNQRIAQLQEQGVAGFTELFESEFGQSTDAERARLDDNDPLALAAATAAIRDEPELTDGHLSTVTLPALIYCGDEDHQFLEGARWAADTMNADFVEIPGSDHMTAQDPERVLPIVMAFYENLGG